MSRLLSSIAALFLAGCSLFLGDSPRSTEAAPPPVAGFPDVVRWGQPLATIDDPEQGETRTILRDPEGEVWAKVHHPPGQLDLITRIDVRRRVEGQWRYETWDPARQAPVELDPEPCHLCHSMAAADGTWTQPPR